jgi:hypothetical protein
MSSVALDGIAVPAGETEGSYLTDGYTIRSWLFTTDHKRIALLYLASITFFFFIGGIAAALVRLNLIVPEGLLGSAETYNRLFTMHGVVMVWFFLVPAVPVTLGNFVILERPVPPQSCSEAGDRGTGSRTVPAEGAGKRGAPPAPPPLATCQHR